VELEGEAHRTRKRERWEKEIAITTTTGITCCCSGTRRSTTRGSKYGQNRISLKLHPRT